jgi:aminoglycoside N3'-acetyltransferase
MDAHEKIKPYVKKEGIKAGLMRLGLKKGDTVGVHSSLSSFGYVEGDADTVIDALLETVGERGNIVMSTHSANLSEDKRTPEMIALGISWLFKICLLTMARPLLRQG